MTAELVRLMRELLSLPRETEWIEFKQNNTNPEEIGEYLSALGNAAALHRRRVAYIIWGIEDGTREVVGTTFKPREQKIGNEELENWLARLLSPHLDFTIHEFEYDKHPVVMFEIKACRHTPVRFRETEFIRVGSYKKKLRDFPEKERSLWEQISAVPFERRSAISHLSDDDVLKLIDYPSYFELT